MLNKAVGTPISLLYINQQHYAGHFWVHLMWICTNSTRKIFCASRSWSTTCWSLSWNKTALSNDIPSRASYWYLGNTSCCGCKSFSLFFWNASIVSIFNSMGLIFHDLVWVRCLKKIRFNSISREVVILIKPGELNQGLFLSGQDVYFKMLFNRKSTELHHH